jgi:hypothetical protein
MTALLAEVHRVLKIGGWHFSLAARHGSYGERTGTRIDRSTFSNIPNGPYKGMVTTRFATEGSLRKLCSKFRNLELNYVTCSVVDGKRVIPHWVLT